MMLFVYVKADKRERDGSKCRFTSMINEEDNNQVKQQNIEKNTTHNNHGRTTTNNEQSKHIYKGW